MKLDHIFETDIPENMKRNYLASKEFKEDLILQNIRKGKLLAIIVIALEFIFASIDAVSCFLKVNDAFPYYCYLAMYLFMIAINLTYLFLINRYKKGKIRPNTMYTTTILFVTLIMVWGGIISLMDQKLYGQLTVFVVNMMACSIIYYFNWRAMSIPFLTSTLFFVIALPFFQKSSNILIGHYVNTAVFVSISWITSRICYRNYCTNYITRKLINQANFMLAEEVNKNNSINIKLAIANAQLTELALVDELTRLPNRRGFRLFIDKQVSHIRETRMMSVIMIDVDYFKQYNDFYGHENGDKALIAISDHIRDSLASADHIAVRWGGEEFIYAAFNASKEDIIGIANDIRLKILDLQLPNHCSEAHPYLTISMGTCTANISSAKDVDHVVNLADKALYQAKENGRNCVVTSEDIRPT